MASVAQQTVPSQSTPALQTLPARSSFIAAFEYDQANLTLTTHLKSGAIYQHKFVLPPEWDLLKSAQSHGAHWTEHIKGKKASVRVKNARAPWSLIKKQGRTSWPQ